MNSRRFMGFPESQQSWTTYNTKGACRAAKAELLCQLWVIHVSPAIKACPVRPKSGHSAKARVMSTRPRQAGTPNTAHRRTTMKGVVFLGDRKLELREFPDPTPGPRDVILAVKASGMCGSDLHTYRAPANPGGVVTGGIKRAAGVIAGHEPCGVVAAAGHRHRAVQGVRGLACPFLGGRRATPARHA